MKTAHVLAAALGLALIGGCQGNTVTPQNEAKAPSEIKLADGRTVMFHDGFTFGGYANGSTFGTKAGQALGTISGKADAGGFIVTIVASATMSSKNIWLFRQGGSMTTVLGKAGLFLPLTTAYSAIKTTDGKTVALSVPGTLPAGTYGISVADAADTAATVIGYTGTLAPKMAFTITDTTAWAHATYTALDTPGKTVLIP
jgi:hypothetical protein